MNLEIVMSLLLFFSAVCYGLLGLRLMGDERDVGSRPVGATFIAIGLWVLGGAIELMAPNFLIFSIGRTGHFLGTAIVPVTILICFREYTGAETSKTMIATLLIVPVLSILIAATNSTHEIMWYLPAANEAGEFLTRPVQWGPSAYCRWILTVVLSSSDIREFSGNMPAAASERVTVDMNINKIKKLENKVSAIEKYRPIRIFQSGLKLWNSSRNQGLVLVTIVHIPAFGP